MTAILHWVRAHLFPRKTRIYQGTEMFGPVLPWHEVLARSTAGVPNPKGDQ